MFVGRTVSRNEQPRLTSRQMICVRWVCKNWGGRGLCILF